MAIASLIVMAVFVGTAAANGVARISGSNTSGDEQYRHNFTTSDDLYGFGVFGFYSYTNRNQQCPAGCGGRVYVVEHRDTWVNGTNLTDVSSDGFETVGWNDTGWGGYYFQLAWQTPLEPGTYDLILDLNVSGTENYYVWTNITNELGFGPDYITDPIWTINVTGDDPPEPIPEFSSMAIPVAAILGLLFLYNYRKRRREG